MTTATHDPALRPTKSAPYLEGPRPAGSLLWIAVTYLVAGNKPTPLCSLLGPFASDKEANLARHVHGRQVAQYELPSQYNHAYAYLVAVTLGELRPYRLEKDDLESHPYLIHLESGRSLRTSRSTIWDVKRPETSRDAVEVKTEHLTKGGQIFVPYRTTITLETIESIERVKLYWDHAEND